MSELLKAITVNEMQQEAMVFSSFSFESAIVACDVQIHLQLLIQQNSF